MNIVVLTTNEQLYLPSFFLTLLRECGDVKAIFCTPPAHGKKKTNAELARQYFRAFGFFNFLQLAIRLIYARFADRIKPASKTKAHSVYSAAKVHGVQCDFVEDVNDAVFLNKLRRIGVDLLVSVSCPQLFKKPLIESAALGCLNIHGAPLPKYRGLLPSFWMMTKGERTAAVTVFFVNERIDAGEVVVMDHFEILPNESLHEFLRRSKQLHCRALLRAIDKVRAGTVATYALDTSAGSYFSFPSRQAYLEFRARGRRLW